MLFNEKCLESYLGLWLIASETLVNPSRIKRSYKNWEQNCKRVISTVIDKITDCTSLIDLLKSLAINKLN